MHVSRLGLAFALCVGLMGCSKLLGLDGLVADRDQGSAAGAAGATGVTSTSTSMVSGTMSTGSQTTSAGGGTQCTGVCGTAGCGTCPPDTGVAVNGAAAGNYKIDKNEVTIQEYENFLATNPSTAGQGPLCVWNDSFEPGVVYDLAVQWSIDHSQPYDTSTCDGWLAKQSPLDGDKPITCLDYCDAAAYCRWANKHLCGKIGGGTLDVTSSNFDDNAVDPELSEWYRACSNAGANYYPYGNTYAMNTCNDFAGHLLPVGTTATCDDLGASGVRDMSGNAVEWVDECTNYGGTPVYGQNCLRLGGAFYDTADDLSCGKKPSDGSTIDHQTLLSLPSDINGFRCCQ